MANPSENIRTIRKDLTPYLFNFLRDDHPAEILHEILNSCELKSENNDYICFTETPITSYISNLDYFQYWKDKGKYAMFSMYGIGIARDVLIQEKGARPVIYGSPEEEPYYTDEHIHWRFQKLDVGTDDFTWLREWRIPSNSLNLNDISKDDIIFIVPKQDEVKEYAKDWDFDVEFEEFEPGECFPYITLVSKGVREWKGFSIDQLREIPDDFAVSANTLTQIIKEKIE